MGKNGVSISDECVEFIRTLIPNGGTILELGSGEGTIRLSEYFKIFSVENQPEWQDKYPICTTYINCRSKMYDNEYTAPDLPEQKGWYHPDDLFANLPESYDLILIDGPGGGRWGRGGFLKHIDKFDTTVPIIFDDAHRMPDLEHMKAVSKHLNKSYNILPSDAAVGYIK